MTVLNLKYQGRKRIQINKKKKVVVTGDFLLNGISEKGLSKNHQVTVENFPG